MANYHCIKCGKVVDLHGHGCRCKDPDFREDVSFEERWLEEENAD